MPREAFAFWTTYDLNHHLPWEMTTTGFNALLPGFEKAYGRERKIGIRARPVRAGDIDFSSEGWVKLTTDVNIDIMLQVGGDDDYKDPDNWSEPVANVYF